MSTFPPTWMYGPNQQAQIFYAEEEIPVGWKDHPSLVEETPAEPAPVPVPAQPNQAAPGDYRTTVPDGDLPPAGPTREYVEALMADTELPPTLEEPRQEPVTPPAPPAAPPKAPKGSVRKLGVKTAPIPPLPDGGTLPAGVRADAISAIRGAGGTIADDAADSVIVDALNALED